MSSPQEIGTSRRSESTMRKSESPSKTPVLDLWSVRERLCLASAVIRNGDQNWMSVSRAMRPFLEPNRPPDWFSQKNCALQYASLLESIDGPRRKKRLQDKSDILRDETPAQTIMRLLTQERIEELRRLMAEEKVMYVKLKEEIVQVKCGQLDDKLGNMCHQIENEKKQQEQEAERYHKWLREREERQVHIQGKPGVPLNIPHSRKRKVGRGGHRRNSNQSDHSSGAESIVESPKAENIEETDPRRITSTHAPTSPLLTSLLKSPAASSSQASSILHSAITSQRAHPLECLLMTSPKVTNVVPPPPSTVSTGLNDLVSNAIGGVSEEHAKPVSSSPSAGAPTLSMLLELPPSLPGKPLPELPSAVRTPAPQTPPPPYSVATSLPLSTASTLTATTSVTITAEQLHHPDHQEMRVRRETGTDEPIEVVELDNIDRALKQLEVQQMEVIEVCPTAALLDESSEDVPLAEMISRKVETVSPITLSADIIKQSGQNAVKIETDVSQETDKISTEEEIKSNLDLDAVTKDDSDDVIFSGNLFGDNVAENIGPSSSALDVRVSRQLQESAILRGDPLQPRLEDHIVQVIVPPDDTVRDSSRNKTSVPEIIDISGDDSHQDMFENQMKDISQAEVLEMIVGPMVVRDPSSFRLLSENEIKKEKEEVITEDYDENAQFGWENVPSESVTQHKVEMIKKEDADGEDIKDASYVISRETSLEEMSELSAEVDLSTVKRDIYDKESESEVDKTKDSNDERGETCDSEKENMEVSDSDNSRADIQGKESLNNTVSEDSKSLNIDVKEKFDVLPERKRFEAEEQEYLTLRSAEEDVQEVSSSIESDKKTLADDESLSATDSVHKEQKSKISKRDKSVKRGTEIKKEIEEDVHHGLQKESSIEKLSKMKDASHLEQRQEGSNKKHKESRELKSLEGAILYNKCRGGSRACGKCYSCLKNVDKSSLKEKPNQETKSDEGSKYQEPSLDKNKTDRDLRQHRRKMAKELEQYSRYEKEVIEKVEEGETSKLKVDNKGQEKTVVGEKEDTAKKEFEKFKQEESFEEISSTTIKSKSPGRRLRGRPVRLCKGNRRCGKCKKCLTRYQKLYKWKAKMKKGRLEKVMAEDEGSNQSQTTIESSAAEVETDSGTESSKTKKPCSKDAPCGDCVSCTTENTSQSGKAMREKDEKISKNDDSEEAAESSKAISMNVKQMCQESAPCGGCVNCKTVKPDDKTVKQSVEGKLKDSMPHLSRVEPTVVIRKLRKGLTVVPCDHKKPCGKCKACLDRQRNKADGTGKEEKDIRGKDETKKEDNKSKLHSRIETKLKVEEHSCQDQLIKEDNEKEKRLQTSVETSRRKTRQSEAKIEGSTRDFSDKESEEKIQSRKKDESKEKPESEIRIEKEKRDRNETKEKKKDYKENNKEKLESKEVVENKEKQESKEMETKDNIETGRKMEGKEKKDRSENRGKIESKEKVETKESKDKLENKGKKDNKGRKESREKTESEEKKESKVLENMDKKEKEKMENKERIEGKELDKLQSKEKKDDKEPFKLESKEKRESKMVAKLESKEKKDGKEVGKLESKEKKDVKELAKLESKEKKEGKELGKLDSKEKKEGKELDNLESKEKKELKSKVENRSKKESRELENKDRTESRKEQKDRVEREGRDSENKVKTRDESAKTIEKKTEEKQKIKEKAEREKSKPGRKKNEKRETVASAANSDVDEEEDDKALSSLISREVKQEPRPSSSAQSEAGGSESVREIKVPIKRRTISISESISSSPLPISEEDREHKAWKKAIMLLHGRLASHKYASLFLRPITEDQAPGYSTTVYRALDLSAIKRNIETGAIKTNVEYQRDVMLMFHNAVMYNRSTHIINEMAREMQEEAMQHIQDFINTQKLVQAKGQMTIRRETRTMDTTTKHIDLPTTSTPSSSLGYDMELGGPFEQLIPTRRAQDDTEQHDRKRKRSTTFSEQESSIAKKKKV